MDRAFIRAAETQGPDAPLTVMTFNVLCSFCDPANFDPWSERLDYFHDIFERHKPDLIGLQEISKGSEVAEFVARNPAYEAIYYRDEAPPNREYPDATILYRRERVEVLERGVYWLSKEPDKAWSKGWAKVQFWRLVVWARMKDKSSGREFYFSTTHFDNNTPNQEMSAPLVLDRVAPWAKKIPCIVTGDFNSKPDSKAYRILMGGKENVGFKLVNTSDLAGAPTIDARQNPKPEFHPDSGIDHVFLADPSGVKVEQWIVDMNVYGPKNRYPSDHFPVVARLRFSGGN